MPVSDAGGPAKGGKRPAAHAGCARGGGRKPQPGPQLHRRRLCFRQRQLWRAGAGHHRRWGWHAAALPARAVWPAWPAWLRVVFAKPLKRRRAPKVGSLLRQHLNLVTFTAIQKATACRHRCAEAHQSAVAFGHRPDRGWRQLLCRAHSGRAGADLGARWGRARAAAVQAACTACRKHHLLAMTHPAGLRRGSEPQLDICGTGCANVYVIHACCLFFGMTACRQVWRARPWRL